MRRAGAWGAAACRVSRACAAPPALLAPASLVAPLTPAHVAARAASWCAPKSLLPAIAQSVRHQPALAAAAAASAAAAAAAGETACSHLCRAAFAAALAGCCSTASAEAAAAPPAAGAGADDEALTGCDDAPPAKHTPPPESGMAELLALARQHWAPMLVVALLTLASTLLKLMVTRRTGALYEQIRRAPSAGGGVPSALSFRPLATVLGLRLGEGVFKALQAWAWARAAARIEAQLASKAFASLLTTDLGALDKAHSGVLASHVAQDAAEATRALETLAFKGVRNVTSVVAGAAALAAVSSDISLCALAMVPPATALFVAVGQWGARLAKAATAKTHAAAALAAERLGAVRTVRSFAQEAAQCSRYDGALSVARDARDAHAAAHAVHVGLLTALPGMGMGLWLFSALQRHLACPA
jgi:hypothetical protein